MSIVTHDTSKSCFLPAGLHSDKPAPSKRPSTGSLLDSRVAPPSKGLEGIDICGENRFSDDDLIVAAQRGDQRAFIELCHLHSMMAKRKIFSILKNHEDTEDVLQETLLRAYTHLRSFRGSCKFSTWLTTIGMNSALMVMRKRRVQADAHSAWIKLGLGTGELNESIDRSFGPEKAYQKRQTGLLLSRAVERLAPNLRSVVSHYYGHDCSLKETAKAQGISVAAAKSRLSRGRVRLRASLKISPINHHNG
jgi:RNA polymerase sigma-70 factor, ECF subfamily